MGVDAVGGDAQVVGDAVGDLLAAVGEGEAGAGVGEALGDNGAETAAGPGDGEDPSVEVGHGGDAIRRGMAVPALSSPSWLSQRVLCETGGPRFLP